MPRRKQELLLVPAQQTAAILRPPTDIQTTNNCCSLVARPGSLYPLAMDDLIHRFVTLTSSLRNGTPSILSDLVFMYIIKSPHATIHNDKDIAKLYNPTITTAGKIIICSDLIQLAWRNNSFSTKLKFRLPVLPDSTFKVYKLYEATLKNRWRSCTISICSTCVWSTTSTTPASRSERRSSRRCTITRTWRTSCTTSCIGPL